MYTDEYYDQLIWDHILEEQAYYEDIQNTYDELSMWCGDDSRWLLR